MCDSFLSAAKASCGLRTGGTRFFQPPGTLWNVDWRDSLFSAPRYPVECGLEGLSPFSPHVLWTVGTQSFQPPGTVDCWASVLSAFRYPVNWWDPVLSTRSTAVGRLTRLSVFSPQAPFGPVGPSHFSPLGTLRTESSKNARIGESSTGFRRHLQ